MGTSGAGKTTAAARLAAALGSKHLDLDELAWLPGWEKQNADAMNRQLAEELRPIAASRWAVGRYPVVTPGRRRREK